MVNPSARYDFFRPELRDDAYVNGDVYSKEKVDKAQAQWNISTYVPFPINSSPKYLLLPAVDTQIQKSREKEIPISRARQVPLKHMAASTPTS